MSGWQSRWRDQLKPTNLPGVWRRKDGGFRVRVTGADPRTGKVHDLNRIFPDARTPLEARQAAQAALQRAFSGPARVAVPQFGEFATALLESKVARGDIRSAAGRRKWSDVLKLHLIPAFGAIYVDQLRRADVLTWLDEQGKLVRKGKVKPQTVNDRISVLRVIASEAVVAFDLERDPMLKVHNLDTSEHPPYTEEEPNSLAPADVPRFLAKMRELHPESFAMVALGFSIGARPSALRPLRRSGERPDVLWNEGAILLRRSHTVGSEVMETTKTKQRQKLYLPPELVDLLRWHVDTQIAPAVRDVSSLLFPAARGGLQVRGSLRVPFDEVTEALELGYRLTPRGMRRTYQDLARAAEIPDAVTRAVSGHLTAEMQQHYSTARADEMRGAIAKVIDLAGVRAARSEAATGNTTGNTDTEANRESA